MAMDYQRIVVSLLSTLGLYSAYKLLRFFYNNLTSPIRVLPGPPSASIIYGNLKQIWEAVQSTFRYQTYCLTHSQEHSVLHEKWVEEYGSTITYKGLIGVSILIRVNLEKACLTSFVDESSIYR